jgi:hypothetical protein
MRTTLDIDDPVMRQLRRRQKGSGKSLGQLASELLAQALAEPPQAKVAAGLSWTSRPMGALVDVADKDALYRALDERG